MGYKIALDAGHGLNTAGKETPDKIKEWTLNDKVRDKVVAFLSEYDCEIIHTDNDEGVTDESLSARTNKYLNAGVDCFVSIHHNAYTGKWNNATGVEVFTDKNPTEADKRLAKCIYERLVKYTGLKGRGIKKENWWVINQNKIPAVLVEGGFMDGSNDYKVITSDVGQTSYAKAVAEGIVEFLGLTKKVNAPVETPKTESKKSNEEIAKEVINGKWGNGADRKARLTAAGYNYSEVQSLVNTLCGKSITTTEPKAEYFAKYTGTSGSIADALKSIGATSSYAYRCKIAKSNDIKNYVGTAKQNITMLNLLKSGKLIKP